MNKLNVGVSKTFFSQNAPPFDLEKGATIFQQGSAAIWLFLVNFAVLIRHSVASSTTKHKNKIDVYFVHKALLPYQISTYRSMKPPISTPIDVNNRECCTYKLQFTTSKYWLRRRWHMECRNSSQLRELRPDVNSSDPCFGTTATAKAGLIELQQQQSVECDADSRCVLQFTPLLLILLAG